MKLIDYFHNHIDKFEYLVSLPRYTGITTFTTKIIAQINVKKQRFSSKKFSNRWREGKIKG